MNSFSKKIKFFAIAVLFAIGGGAVTATVLPFLAHADEVPAAVASPLPVAGAVDTGALVEAGKSLFEAVKSSNWTMVFAFGLLLLTYVFRMFVMPKLNMHPTKWLPALVAVVGVLGAFATNMAAGQSWLTALLAGLTVGTSASGLWNLIGGAFPKVV